MLQDLVVLGLQYGDEGKGRIIDLIASKEDSVVVRFSGGPNAGHTVVRNGGIYKFHQIPSGIVANRTCLIGGGCVINLSELERELEEVENISPRSLLNISSRAHVIMPYHIAQDLAEEQWRNRSKNSDIDGISSLPIGTTRKGIGPCYSDKAARIGFRIGDLLLNTVPITQLARNILFKKNLLAHCYNFDISDDDERFNIDSLLKKIDSWRSLFKDRIIDDVKFLSESRMSGKRLIFEGAQSFGIDIEYGRYPYTTSSVASIGGAVISGAINPHCIGVTKCYSIAVGVVPCLLNSKMIFRKL